MWCNHIIKLSRTETRKSYTYNVILVSIFPSTFPFAFLSRIRNAKHFFFWLDCFQYSGHARTKTCFPQELSSLAHPSLHLVVCSFVRSFAFFLSLSQCKRDGATENRKSRFLRNRFAKKFTSCEGDLRFSFHVSSFGFPKIRKGDVKQVRPWNFHHYCRERRDTRQMFVAVKMKVIN